ncbi:hypothetical protein GCM10020331_054530 [Ectobacillus funiculus]
MTKVSLSVADVSISELSAFPKDVPSKYRKPYPNVAMIVNIPKTIPIFLIVHISPLAHPIWYKSPHFYNMPRKKVLN